MSKRLFGAVVWFLGCQVALTRGGWLGRFNDTFFWIVAPLFAFWHFLGPFVFHYPGKKDNLLLVPA